MSILTCNEENPKDVLKCFLTSSPGNPGSPAEPGFPRSPSGPFGFKWQCVRCNNILNVANYNINAWHKNTDIYSRTIFTGVTSIALQEKHTFNSSIMHNVLVTELLYILNYIHIFEIQLTSIPSIPGTPGGPGPPAPALCSKIVSKQCCHIPTVRSHVFRCINTKFMQYEN